jgi:group I intron endonuclease
VKIDEMVAINMNDGKWRVYVHINNVNGKRYVGITSKPKPEDRWRNGKGYSENPYFKSSIDKYGWDNFDHIILHEGLSETDAKEKEKYYIRVWDTKNREFGYNMTSGGDGTPGYYPSEETRKKLSIARMKENLSEETLKRRSDGLRGRKFSEQHKRKIGDGNSKEISMYTKDGNFIRTFKSAIEAEIELNINHTHISQCCHNKRKTTGGYVWKFTQSA